MINHHNLLSMTDNNPTEKSVIDSDKKMLMILQEAKQKRKKCDKNYQFSHSSQKHTNIFDSQLCEEIKLSFDIMKCPQAEQKPKK